MAVIDCFYDSEILGCKTAMRALLPDEGRVSDVPVFYLLHGLDGTYLSWFDNTDLIPLVERYQIAIILPDAKNSFYQNMTTGERYYDHIVQEVPKRARHYFGICDEMEKQHVAGISMGAFGALRIALKNPGMFSTVGILSAVLDMVSKVQKKDHSKVTPIFHAAFGDNLKLDKTDNDISFLLKMSIDNPIPRLYQFCGTEDFLYKENVQFRDLARALHIDLKYIENIGDHTWPCWAEQIKYYIPWALGLSY